MAALLGLASGPCVRLNASRNWQSAFQSVRDAPWSGASFSFKACLSISQLHDAALDFFYFDGHRIDLLSQAWRHLRQSVDGLVGQKSIRN